MEDMLGGAGAAKAPAAAGGAADQQQEGEEGGIVLAGSSSRRGKENVAPNKGAAAGGAQQQPPAPAGPKPDLGESYKAWVQYQKNRWRQVGGPVRLSATGCGIVYYTRLLGCVGHLVVVLCLSEHLDVQRLDSFTLD
jgi:hypothetical protein